MCDDIWVLQDGAWKMKNSGVKNMVRKSPGRGGRFWLIHRVRRLRRRISGRDLKMPFGLLDLFVPENMKNEALEAVRARGVQLLKDPDS